MDRDRPGGDAGRPGDSPSEFGEWTAAQQGGRVSPPDPPAAAAGDVASSEQRPKFTVGGRFPGTARRTGGALSSARHGSHGLEVVHAAEHSPPAKHSEDSREDPSDPPPEDDIAARMMQELEEAVAELRRHAAGRLISLQRPNEPLSQDLGQTRSGPLVHACGFLYKSLARILQRVRRVAAEKPEQGGPQHARFWLSGAKIAATFIAIGLALGAALRLRK